MDKKKLIVFFVVFLIISLNLLIKVDRISFYNQILEIDPYFNLAINQEILLTGNFPSHYIWSLQTEKVGLPPIFYVFNAILSLVTGASPYYLLKWFVPIAFSVLYLSIFYLLSREVLNSRRDAIFSTLVFASIGFLNSRFIIPLYESVAFIFILTSLYLFFKDSKIYRIPILLFVIFAIFSHPMGYLGLMLIFFLYFSDTRTEKINFKSLILPIVLLLFVFVYIDLQRTLIFYLSTFFNPSLHSHEVSVFFQGLLSRIGAVPLLLSAIAFGMVWNERNRSRANFLMWRFLILIIFLHLVFLFFIIDQNQIGRLVPYLAIILSLISSRSINHLFVKKKSLLSIFLIIVVLLPFIYSWGWIPRYSNYDLEAKTLLISQVKDSTDCLVVSQQEYRYYLMDGLRCKIYTEEGNVLIREPERLVSFLQDRNFSRTFVFISEYSYRVANGYGLVNLLEEKKSVMDSLQSLSNNDCFEIFSQNYDVLVLEYKCANGGFER